MKISKALSVLKRKNVFPKDRKVNAIALAGGGSSVDTGMARLLAAAEQNHEKIYFCYNNEEYRKKVIQRSKAMQKKCWKMSTLS